MENEKHIVHSKKSPAIQHLCRIDNVLCRVIHTIGDLSYSVYKDSFSFMVNTIVGQMLSNKVAGIISERLYKICDGDITPARLRCITVRQLREIGLSNSKSGYIIDFANFCCDSPDYFYLLENESDETVMKELTSLRGIGSWSAKMYLIFVLNRYDILPFEDGAFQQAFRWLYPNIDIKKKDAVIAQCAAWSPYSSIASRYLYVALDSGLVGRLL